MVSFQIESMIFRFMMDTRVSKDAIVVSIYAAYTMYVVRGEP